MADSLAFELTLPAARLPALAAALAGHLEPGSLASAEALAAQLHDPESRPLALTFHFAPDEVLEAFRREHPEAPGAREGTVAIGYVFAALRGDERAVHVSFFTTSRALVEVLRESPNVRGFFRSLAPLAEPPEVRVVDEWNDATLL